MNKFTVIKISVITLFLIGLVMVIMSSCNTSDRSGNIHNTFSTVRIRVLENNRISFLRIPDHLSKIYTTGDTVSVDIDRHMIDEASESDLAIRCVIELPIYKSEYTFDVDGTDSVNIYTIYDADHNKIGVVKPNQLDSLIDADNL